MEEIGKLQSPQSSLVILDIDPVSLSAVENISISELWNQDLAELFGEPTNSTPVLSSPDAENSLSREIERIMEEDIDKTLRDKNLEIPEIEPLVSSLADPQKSSDEGKSSVTTPLSAPTISTLADSQQSSESISKTPVTTGRAANVSDPFVTPLSNRTNISSGPNLIQKHLFYPEPIPKSKKMDKERIKVPHALSSELWREIKMEEAKKKEEQEAKK